MNLTDIVDKKVRMGDEKRPIYHLNCMPFDTSLIRGPLLLFECPIKILHSQIPSRYVQKLIRMMLLIMKMENNFQPIVLIADTMLKTWGQKNSARFKSSQGQCSLLVKPCVLGLKKIFQGKVRQSLAISRLTSLFQLQILVFCTCSAVVPSKRKNHLMDGSRGPLNCF